MTRVHPRIYLISLLLLSIAGSIVGCSTEAEPEQRPDVVLVMIDTLRPDHLGFYGYEEDTAPFLASLARRSAVFTRAHSTSSWTAPATASVFTGLYPTDHGVTMGFFSHRGLSARVEAGETVEMSLNRISGSAPTLPECFQAAGYRTFGLGSNVNIGSEIGFDRGFDHFERLTHTDHNASPGAEVIRAKLDEWKPELQAGGPNFVYLHYMDPHRPYSRRSPWFKENERRLGTGLEAAYDSEISYLDKALEELFNDYGWSENTILMLISDHGEEFKEHGRMGHKESLYAELVRVLAMIHAPELGIRTGNIDGNVSLIDVLPTLCSLAGVPVPSDLPGMDLSTLLNEDSNTESFADELDQRPLFAHRGLEPGYATDAMWAVMQGKWKLIKTPEGSMLFDTESDPQDQVDLLAAQPEVADFLGGLLEQFGSSASWGDGERGSLQIDAETLEQLKKLGYAD